MDRAKALLEGDSAHGRRAHHMGAGVKVIRVGVDFRQVFKHQPHAFQRDALGHRVVEGRGIGLKAMRQRVHAGACGDEFGHADSQCRVADGDDGQQFGVEDDLLLVGDRVGQNARAAHFRTCPSCRRHGDDRRDFGAIGAGEPIVDVFQIPDGKVFALMRHQGNHLAKVQRRAATKADHPVMATRQIDGDAVGHVFLVRVWVHFREDGGAKTCGFQHGDGVRRDRQGGQRLVGDKERLFHTCGGAMLGQLSDAADAEFDGGGVGPVAVGNRMRGHEIRLS